MVGSLHPSTASVLKVFLVAPLISQRSGCAQRCFCFSSRKVRALCLSRSVTLSSPFFQPDFPLLPLTTLFTFLHIPILLISPCIFAFPSVPKLVGSWLMILRLFPRILQLIGYSCEVIVCIGHAVRLTSSVGYCKTEIVGFHWYMKYSDSLWITLMLIYQLILLFESRMDSSKYDKWISNVT